jgi:hypothetical protein
MQWKHIHGAAVAHYNLGYLLYKKGKKEAAGEQFKLALAQDPQLRQAAQMLARLKPQPPVVRSNQLPSVIHAPPATPAATQPPVANQALPPFEPAAPPPSRPPEPSPERVTTGPVPPPDEPYQPAPRTPTSEPATPAPAPTTLAPVVRPEDYRNSRFSGSLVPDATQPGALPTPPAPQNPITDPLIDRSPLLENTTTPSAQHFPQSPLGTEAEDEPSQGDATTLPALEEPASPSGVVRPRSSATDAPQTLDRDSPFSLGTPPAAGYEPFSPQREPLPVFTPEPSDSLETSSEPKPSGLIHSVEPPAAAHEPFSLQREPPLKYLPRPLPSDEPPPSDEREPAAGADSSPPPAFLRHRPADAESTPQQDRGYVRLRPQQAPPTPQPRAMSDTRPVLRLPRIDTSDNDVGRPAPPPLPPDQDARFIPSTTQQPRELYPVR